LPYLDLKSRSTGNPFTSRILSLLCTLRLPRFGEKPRRGSYPVVLRWDERVTTWGADGVGRVGDVVVVVLRVFSFKLRRSVFCLLIDYLLVKGRLVPVVLIN